MGGIDRCLHVPIYHNILHIILWYIIVAMVAVEVSGRGATIEGCLYHVCRIVVSPGNLILIPIWQHADPGPFRIPFQCHFLLM